MRGLRNLAQHSQMGKSGLKGEAAENDTLIPSNFDLRNSH